MRFVKKNLQAHNSLLELNLSCENLVVYSSKVSFEISKKNFNELFFVILVIFLQKLVGLFDYDCWIYLVSFFIQILQSHHPEKKRHQIEKKSFFFKTMI